jgi:lipopolysaccharide heptosyltransferase II
MRQIDFEPKKIIVRMPNWIGDMVMATPILSDLKKAFPSSEITAMCKKPICTLLENDPNLDELFCFTKPDNRFFEKRIEKRNIIAKLRSSKYDLGILLTNSFSSAWWFWQGKVLNRVGFDCNLRNFLLTYPVVYSDAEKIHQVDQYKKLLAPLKIEASKTKPKLYLTESELSDCCAMLEHYGYTFDKPLIGINPGAQYGIAKCWPKEKFRRVIQKLIKKKDCFVICFGDDKNIDIVKEICAYLPENVINLANLTSLRELACLINFCTVLLTNDSGPLHIADALGVEVVAIFGSTNPNKTGPYSKGKVINAKVSCSPCYLRECPIDFRCMHKITEDEVLKALLAQIENYDKKTT